MSELIELPEELINHISSFLRWKRVLTFQSVCKRFYQIVKIKELPRINKILPDFNNYKYLTKLELPINSTGSNKCINLYHLNYLNELIIADCTNVILNQN